MTTRQPNIIISCFSVTPKWPDSRLVLASQEQCDMEADKCTFLGLRQHRTSDSVGFLSPTAYISDSVGLLSPTAYISDSVGLLSPTASDFYLRQRRTGLQSPTASDFNLQQLASSISFGKRSPRVLACLMTSSKC